MFDLDAPLTPGARLHGAAAWQHLAASQRWVRGFVSCALCGILWPDGLAREMAWDRIDAGGPYTLRNGQLTCPTCNSSKGDKPNAEAVRALGATRGMSMLERRRASLRKAQAKPEAVVRRRQRQSTPEYREQRRPRHPARVRFGQTGGNRRLLDA